MHRVGLIGLSHRTASLKQLEPFVMTPDALAERLQALKQHCGFSEVVYTSTCNRVEIAFATEESGSVELLRRVATFFAPEASPEELEAMTAPCYVLRGTEAASHLFKVASSLDSMVVGETEILRQTKRAYQTACDLDTVGPVLHTLFNQALKCAKRVHTETRLTSRPVSMVSLATGLIREQLTRAPVGARVVLVGAGEMTVKTATYLVSQGATSLVFVNRTVDRAEALARRFGGEAIRLDDFLREPGNAEVIVSATSAPGPLFLVENLRPLLEHRHGQRPVLLIDLALPRDFETALDTHPAARVYDLEALKVVSAQNQEARAEEITRALPLIDYQLRIARRKLAEGRVGPAVSRLREATLATTGEELERLLGRDLPHLSEADKAVLRSWASGLGQRLSQLPIGSLKEVALSCECVAPRGTVLPEVLTLNHGASPVVRCDHHESALGAA